MCKSRIEDGTGVKMVQQNFRNPFWGPKVKEGFLEVMAFELLGFHMKLQIMIL